MKIYIAGPMSGLPEFNYPAFRDAEAKLVAHGYAVLNPIHAELENTSGSTKPWQWYMRRALRMVSEADAIALLPGWEASKGAQLESHIGKELRLPRETVDTWVHIADAEASAVGADGDAENPNP